MDIFKTVDDLKKANFNCSSGMWTEFAEGNLWADFKKELHCWLADTWASLEVEEEPTMISQLQGRARCIRDVLQLPDGVIHMIEQTEED